ncbi:MAG: M24 family metallopeptidase [Kofleriaceae bacterium]
MIHKIALVLALVGTVVQAQPAGAPAPKPPAAKAPAPRSPAAKAPAPKQAPAVAPAVAPIDPYADPKPAPKAVSAKVTPAPARTPAKPVDPYTPSNDNPIPSRVGLSDLTAVQGLLAVQHLDGWLLYDRDGSNPIAVRLVAPSGHPQRPWFYLIPAAGDPIALVHNSELRQFDHLPGKKLTYLGYRDFAKQLSAMLKGVKQIALEYSPKAAVPNMSRVDAGTLELIRATGVQVRSSATLVQYTKAIWGDAGRTAHYIAVHHIVELRKEALAFIAQRLLAHVPVNELEVQQKIIRGMSMRGLVGPPPIVATGINTADPYYVPTAARTAMIQLGDPIVISIAAKLDKPEGIYAAQTWVAVADKTVPEKLATAFQTVAAARDQALVMITDRGRKHRPVTGAEVDQATRAFLKKAGFAAQVMHRTGHSIDNDLQGGGADLDDFEVRDTRILTPGTGFTVGPGLYFAGQFGVRTEVSVYLAPNGPEITTPAQDDVEPLLR